MNDHDRAIVVGIRRYADAGHDSGWISDLNGPDNDAAAVARWLRKKDGGGLPRSNVRVVRSADFPNPVKADGAGPDQRAVTAELNRIAELPTTAYKGQYIGRRLYIYVSGHGLVTQEDEAALITADATIGRPLNVLINSWLSYFYGQAHFEEYVLWVDTCATLQSDAFLQPCDRRRRVAQSPADSKRFIAFAAGFRKSAVENEMADGKWHGAFTYALLQGLQGAAAGEGENGEVTTESLRKYLINNMNSFMREEQRASSKVGQEPAFPATDTMSFGAPRATSKYKVTLRFPPEAVGRLATVSVDADSPVAADKLLRKPEWTVRLETGLYVASVPELNRYEPFEVTGGEADDAVVTVP